MPTRLATRQLALAYEEEVQKQIHTFLKKHIKYDVLNGNRDITLYLTVAEAQYLYCANDAVKAKAASGELAELHRRC